MFFKQSGYWIVYTIEEVVESDDEKEPSQLNGGENAEALQDNGSTSITNSDSLVEQLIVMEKHGYKIPATKEERDELIEHEHSFGHFGRDAVCAALIRKSYWWRGMRNDIIRIIADCDPCNRCTIVRRGFNPAVAITSDAPWCHIELDSIVHLPASPGGYTAVLVIIDVFTGFIILRAIKTTSADIVANELWQVCCIFGVPKIIQSDNGPEFVNGVLRALVKLTGVDHRFIAPYNPRADGKVERSIRTVKSIIKKLIHGDEQHWPLFVPFAQLAFNNKVAALTGSTPFALMFGRQMNELKDYTKLDVDGNAVVVDVDDWKKHMEKVQSLIYPAIFDRTMVTKDKMIKSLDKQRKLLTTNAIPVGAIVMLRDPSDANTLVATYSGPYSVIRRTRNGNYQLKDGTGHFVERHIPPDQLKLISKTPRQRDLDTMEYEIDHIVSHRGDVGSYEYQTKFKGFRELEWIAEENFVDTRLIRDYWLSESKNQSSQ